MSQTTIAIDPTIPGIVLIGFGAYLGYRRGPSSALVTVVGIALAALVFSSVQGRNAVARLIQAGATAVAGVLGTPAPHWLTTVDSIAVLGALLFLTAIVLVYVCAGRLGETPAEPEQRGISLVLGGLTGFVVALGAHALMGAGTGGRPTRVSITLPTVEFSDPGAQFVMVQYAPVVFLLALSAVAALAALASRRAR